MSSFFAYSGASRGTSNIRAVSLAFMQRLLGASTFTSSYSPFAMRSKTGVSNKHFHFDPITALWKVM